MSASARLAGLRVFVERKRHRELVCAVRFGLPLPGFRHENILRDLGVALRLAHWPGAARRVSRRPAAPLTPAVRHLWIAPGDKSAHSTERAFRYGFRRPGATQRKLEASA